MPSSRRTTFLLAAALGLVSAAPAWSQQAAHLDAPEVREKKVGGVFLIEGSFQVGASSNLVWNVLSDYEHIGNFVSSIRKSVILERHERSLVLEQRAIVRALFVSKEVRLLLDVQEIPGRTIIFQDTSHSDFDLYEGTWNITETTSGSRVLYRLRAKPRTVVPSAISSDFFKSTAVELLNQVRSEIVRRIRDSGQSMATGLRLNH